MSFIEFLNEMQIERRAAAKRAQHNKYDIVQRLVKVVKCEDYFNNKKHIVDIIGWVKQINQIKPSGERFTKEYYSFIQPSKDYLLNDVLTKKFRKDYGRLAEVRNDDETFYVILEILEHIQELLQSKHKHQTNSDHSNLNGLDRYLSTFNMPDYE